MNAMQRRWARWWLRWGGPGPGGRLASRAAAAFSRPYYGCHRLARLHARGYTAPGARLAHGGLVRGAHVFIDEDVLVYEDVEGGAVRLGDRVHLHRGTIIQTGRGGELSLGEDCAIQARCHFAAYVGPIRLGRGVQVAPNCAFFSYNHGLTAGEDMRALPLTSRGGISVGDGAWIGAGAILLDGAQIGAGAVIAAGAVVSGAVPEQAIAGGVPARVIGERPSGEGAAPATRQARGGAS